MMLNVFSKLHRGGTTIQIRGANELILALFGVMGIAKVAKLIRHK